MGFVFSPSNIMTYRTCPRKFWGQSISKLLKWTPSKQKSRGTLLHEQIQNALRDVNKAAEIYKDTTLDGSYVSGCIAHVHSMRNQGYQLYIEHEMCMKKSGEPESWWGNAAFLRAKADAMLMHEDPEKPIWLIDIKTGKVWDNSYDQLRLECLLAHIIYQRPVVQFDYWYIDQGEDHGGIIDFRNGLAPVQDLYETMQEMSLAIKNNDFPCTKNNLCRWCGFYQTKDCDAK